MTARHHHYLSQCYLKGFTKGNAKKSKLTVFDVAEKKKFETIPRNVGGIRDFNRLDIEGVDQNLLEQDLSDFEGNAAKALKQLSVTKSFTGETKKQILYLIALLAIRSPERREHMRKFQARIADLVVGMALESRERWELQMNQMKENDPSYQSNVTYEEVKDFYDSKEYTIEVAREHHIKMEMTQIDAILPRLYGRQWVLVEATENTGPFVTCDNPVNLSWINPDQIPPIHRSSPGFGLVGTQVYFPVTQGLALMGEFEGKEGVVQGNEELVAICNSSMLHSAYRHIYAPKSGFKFYGKGGEIMIGARIEKEFNA